MKLVLATVLLCLLGAPAQAQNQQHQINAAFAAAIDSFEQARPSLGRETMGVDVAAYRDALTLQRFESRFWGVAVGVDLANLPASDSACRRFAAFVRIPPDAGRVRLGVCPQFFTPGADDLRVLTILHEMVHVVAGPDECRAMAFAARIEQLATGTFTPVDRYWRANGCLGSAYQLPD